MLVTADSHRLQHEHALATLLEGRAPLSRVQPLGQGRAACWQEQPGFGKRSGGGRSGDQPGGNSGRRQRQFSARVGHDLVTISSDAEERFSAAFNPGMTTLLAGMADAFRI